MCVVHNPLVKSRHEIYYLKIREATIYQDNTYVQLELELAKQLWNPPPCFHEYTNHTDSKLLFLQVPLQDNFNNNVNVKEYPSPKNVKACFAPFQGKPQEKVNSICKFKLIKTVNKLRLISTKLRSSWS